MPSASTLNDSLSCGAGRSSPSRLARTAEEAGPGQPAGAEAWVTRTGAALCSKAPPKAQPRPRAAGKQQAPGKRVRMQCSCRASLRVKDRVYVQPRLRRPRVAGEEQAPGKRVRTQCDCRRLLLAREYCAHRTYAHRHAWRAACLSPMPCAIARMLTPEPSRSGGAAWRSASRCAAPPRQCRTR